MLSSQSSLRRQVLAFVSAMVVLALVSSSISLLRITEANRLLESIGRVVVPLGRILAQIQSDSEGYLRELERGLARSHWKDPKWHATAPTQWMEQGLENEFKSLEELVKRESDWAQAEDREQWLQWWSGLSAQFQGVFEQSHRLYFLLEGQDELKAQQLEPLWSMNVQACRRQLQWGASEYELLLRRGFSVAENRLGELKLSLEVLLVVVVLMSLLLLWLGERALRPLSELIGLARSITLRGLRKEDKALVPLLPISRKDEVSQLAREFHSMATSLLEREKTVESQNQRLQQQNRLLREMGDLKERLRHAESLAAVGRMSAQVAHEVRNPLHSIGLEAEMAAERSSALGDPFLKQSLQSILSSVDRLQKITENYLKLSRLSRGQKAWVNLHELLGEVLSSYAPVFQEQKIQAHCQIESPVLGQTPEFLVWVDRDLMVQVLGNLLTNAIQAISENRLEDPDGRLRDLKGVISISMTQLETGAVGLKIQDNGPGISDSVAEKIFNPFFTTRAQGTGLGLSFIKKVIEDHGGSIRYLKNLSAQGACFEMLFPHPDALQMKEMRSPLGGEKMANSEEFQTNLAPSEPSSEGRTPCPEFY